MNANQIRIYENSKVRTLWDADAETGKKVISPRNAKTFLEDKKKSINPKKGNNA